MSGEDGVRRRYLLVLCAGRVEPERLEPFATLAAVLQGTVDDELRIVLTDGWPEAFWTTEVAGALDAADVTGDFELAPTFDQRRRALAQRVGDGALEVLFIERGRVQGSALTVVARRTEEGRPLPLNVKTAALSLMQAARDALVWRPRAMEELVRDLREALGLPAGPMVTLAEVRREHQSAEEDREAARSGHAPEPEVAWPPRAPPSGTPPVVRQPIRQAGPPPATRTPLARPPAAERHVLEEGRCTRCGKSGARLEEPCGAAELGRMGFLELD